MTQAASNDTSPGLRSLTYKISVLRLSVPIDVRLAYLTLVSSDQLAPPALSQPPGTTVSSEGSIWKGLTAPAPLALKPAFQARSASMR